MRRYFGLLSLVLIAALAFAFGQQAKPHSAGAAGGSLPSRATVGSFLKHMFGFDPTVAWTITDIKPSPAAGISEITIDVKTPQKSGQQKIHVLPGNKQAILGEMTPFPGEPGAPKPSDSSINSFVRQATGGVNPSITWSIAEVKPNAIANLSQVTVVLTTPKGQGAVSFFVTADSKWALRGDISPFAADPFAADRAKLEKGLNGPWRGPANAPLTIVEFADLQCPACKMANSEIQRLVADEPKARFVFQQFPLTQIHKWAFTAAEFGDCVYRENPAAFWKYVEQVYGAQETISAETGNSEDAGKKAEAKLIELATAAGADGKKVAACASQPATAERVNQSVELAKNMQVTATPTLFLNGRRVPNLSQIPQDQLKRLADFMAVNK